MLELLALRVAHDRPASRSDSTARRCSYQPIASASSVSDAHRRANVRVSSGSSSAGSWYWSKPMAAFSLFADRMGIREAGAVGVSGLPGEVDEHLALGAIERTTNAAA